MKNSKKFLKSLFLSLILSNGFAATTLFSMKRSRNGNPKTHRMTLRSDVSRTRSGKKRAREKFLSLKYEPKKRQKIKEVIENPTILPPEILRRIFLFLDPNDYKSFALAGRYFYSIFLMVKNGNSTLPNWIKSMEKIKTRPGKILRFLSSVASYVVQDAYKSKEATYNHFEFLIRHVYFVDGDPQKRAWDDCTEEVKILLDSPYMNEVCFRNGFFWACREGKDEIVKTLLEYSKCFDFLDQGYARDSFWMAIGYGNPKVVAILLENDSFVSFLDKDFVQGIYNKISKNNWCGCKNLIESFLNSED